LNGNPRQFRPVGTFRTPLVTETGHVLLSGARSRCSLPPAALRRRTCLYSCRPISRAGCHRTRGLLGLFAPAGSQISKQRGDVALDRGHPAAAPRGVRPLQPAALTRRCSVSSCLSATITLRFCAQLQGEGSRRWAGSRQHLENTGHAPSAVEPHTPPLNLPRHSTFYAGTEIWHGAPRDEGLATHNTPPPSGCRPQPSNRAHPETRRDESTPSDGGRGAGGAPGSGGGNQRGGRPPRNSSPEHAALPAAPARRLSTRSRLMPVPSP